MSQTSNILEYLKKGNTITPIEALNLFDCFRLSARILELRECGYNIITDLIESNGKRFAQYRLKD